LVITAGHCRSNVSTDPEVDGTRVPMGQWALLTSPFTVRVGTSRTTADPAHTYTARFTTQAGWADIQILMLDRPVPASQATPVRPLTHLTPAESAVGFWGRQTFTVSGFGGGRPTRLTGHWSNARFPCKNVTSLMANDEMFCALTHNGVELEPGDSGSPIFWQDEFGARRLIGVYQGNVQRLRTCDPADGTGLPCGPDTQPKIVGGPATGSSSSAAPRVGGAASSTCFAQSPVTTTYSAWSPMHHTSVFAAGGTCWTDTAGVTRHLPNIAAWIDDAILYAPAANTHKIRMVMQRTSPTRVDIVPEPGGDFAQVIGTADMENARAPNLFTPAETLWEWQVEGAPGRVFYTAARPGHHFSKPTMSFDHFGTVTLSSPAMVARLFDTAAGLTNPARFNSYINLDSGELLSTWDLPATITDPTARARWSIISIGGYVDVIPTLHATVAPGATAPLGPIPLKTPPTLHH
jgi:hypothetical protein